MPRVNSEGNLVLIHYHDQPAVYARIEGIEPDIKKGWYQVTLLLLTIPAQTVTWILREAYINGASFTMGGQAIRLEEVPRLPQKVKSQGAGPSSGQGDRDRPAKVIPFKKEP